MQIALMFGIAISCGLWAGGIAAGKQRSFIGFFALGALFGLVGVLGAFVASPAAPRKPAYAPFSYAKATAASPTAKNCATAIVWPRG